MADKAQFAALPVRAIGDQRLTLVEFRALACIAFHDRMSGHKRGNGQGAWASNKTMAAEIGCHFTNVSSAITRLAQLGYISREQHHFDKRKFVYRVIYDGPDCLPDDKQYNDQADPDSLPTDKRHVPHRDRDSLSADEPISKVVCLNSENLVSNQHDIEGKYIPLSGGIHSVETGQQHSAKLRIAAAKRVDDDDYPQANIIAELAQIERAFRAGELAGELPIWRDYLVRLWERAISYGDDLATAKTTAMASRLIGEFNLWLFEHPEDQPTEAKPPHPGAGRSADYIDRLNLKAAARVEKNRRES